MYKRILPVLLLLISTYSYANLLDTYKTPYSKAYSAFTCSVYAEFNDTKRSNKLLEIGNRFAIAFAKMYKFYGDDKSINLPDEVPGIYTALQLRPEFIAGSVYGAARASAYKIMGQRFHKTMEAFPVMAEDLYKKNKCDLIK